MGERLIPPDDQHKEIIYPSFEHTEPEGWLSDAMQYVLHATPRLIGQEDWLSVGETERPIIIDSRPEQQ